FVCPCAEPSDPEGWGEGTLGMLGHGMTRSDVREHLIIQRSGVPLTDSTEITTHNPSKAGEFGDVEPCPMRIQLLQITGMVKNAWHLLDLPVLKTQVRIVDLGKEILRMTAIGFPNQGGGVLLVTSRQIGNAEMVRKRGNMGIGSYEPFQLRYCLCGITLCQLIEVVNACLHLCWEPLDVAIVERFIGNVVLGVHQGMRGRRLRSTQCVRRLGLLTPWWAFLGCHRALPLDV